MRDSATLGGVAGRSSRREFVRRVVGGMAAAGVPIGASGEEEGRPGAAEPELIVRSLRPLDAETPVEVFDRWNTPNRLFFIRSHFGPPAVGLFPWKLHVGGEVERPFSMAAEDLARLDHVVLPAVLQCSGNGRASFRPNIPGVGWDRGAVGNAEWGGVRLADILERAGVRPGAGHVHLLGADGPPSPKTPPFLRSIPMARALDPRTLVAFEMNGEPLPPLHGGPLRLVVPGWTGNHWMKWLRRLTVAKDEAPGFYMQKGYRIPKTPVPPGVEPRPEDLVPLTTLNVKSLVAWPPAGSVLPAGRHEVRGVAWTGEGRVARVEVSTGGDPAWSAAELVGPDVPFAWRLWRFPWDARTPGRYTLRVRASDSLGQVQPETTPWNRSGYLWNGIDAVDVEVRPA